MFSILRLRSQLQGGILPSILLTFPHPTSQFPLPISFIALRAHSYRANVCFFKKQLRVYLGMRDREYEKNFLYFPFSHRVHKSYSSLKDRMYQKKTKTLEVCIPCTKIILFSFSVVLESNQIFKKIFTQLSQVSKWAVWLKPLSLITLA